MQFTHITSLVFDFDGTLATCPYDFAHMRRVILLTAEEHGLDPQSLLGHGLLEMIEVGTELLAADLRQAEAFHAEALQRLCAIEYEAAAQTRLLPGIVDALDGLRTLGFRLGIVTRNSTAAVRRIIGQTSLPFDALLCREDVTHPKPHIDHVRQVLRLLDAMPLHALMVGDHPTDIQMGKAAGMATVAVLTGQTGETELRAAEPDLLLSSVMALAQLLLGEWQQRARSAEQA